MTAKLSGFFYGRNMGDLSHHIAEAGTATMQTKAAYTAAVVTGTSSVLTFNEIIGAVGVVASILLASFTAWSNHKKNKAIIASLNNTDASRQREAGEV